MCVDTYLYIPTARVFFLVGLPMDCRGVGGGGMGLGIAPWTQAWVKNLSRPSKTQMIFWCIPNKGKGERLLGEVRKGAWILGAWLTLESSSLFFLTPFCSASFFSFLGTLRKKICRTAPLRQPFGLYKIVFFYLVRVLFKSFFGLGNSSLLKTFFLPALPLF